MVMQLLIATSNAGKIREITHEIAAAGLGTVQPRSLADFPAIAPVVEDQPSFAGNAMKKAAAYARAFGVPALADDSGLCVDALNGAPGVLSARYAGEPCNDSANNHHLLRELRNVPPEKRSARFVCAVALATPSANLALMVESLEGQIIDSPRGANGFGYDPLFFLPHLNCTTAELTLPQKALLSHRGKAVRQMIDWLKRNLPAIEACAAAAE